MALITIREYMESRRKEIDRYVEGEHKWYGDVNSTADVTYNMQVIPWYCAEESAVLKQQGVSRHGGHREIPALIAN